MRILLLSAASACALAASACDSTTEGHLDATVLSDAGPGIADASHHPDAAQDATVASDAGFVDAAGGADATPDSGLRDTGSLPADSGPADSGPTDSGVDPDAPISAPALVWTWADIPGAVCDDGTPTGIGVSLNPASQDVLVFMMGGGACWDYETCFVLNTSTHGPFGRTQFDLLSSFLVGVANRSDANNPFREYNMVFVPYCTGDIHGGNNDATYLDPGGNPHVIHHRGFANMQGALRRLTRTLEHPNKLVLAGSSAGGFGALLNYESVRTAWNPAQMYLVDDSGPTFVGDSIDPSLRGFWYDSWRLGDVLDPVCGMNCRDDLSLGMSTLAARYPNDRLALLSSLQDSVISGYYGVTGAQFQQRLEELATEVIEPTTNFRYFFVTGSSHTMLGNPQSFTTMGVGLRTWLARQVNDDAQWASIKP